MQLRKGDKVYFPDGDKFFYGEWTGLQTKPDYGSAIFSYPFYLIHCYDCGELHPVPKEQLYPLPDMQTTSTQDRINELKAEWFSYDEDRSDWPTSDTGYTSLGVHLEGIRRAEADIARGGGVSFKEAFTEEFNKLRAFKRAVNREKYQRRRAMALVITGLCSAIVAGFSFLDGRLILGAIATLAYIACFGLSYLVERRD